MFDRLNLLLNSENVSKMQNLNVLLIGVGGVGGMAFEMLVRLGIKNITIIDYDIIEESNLNRQLLTTSSNIGKYKVLEAKKRASIINKHLNINVINKKLDENLINEIDSNYDYIIDAIDDIKAKILLIKFAIKNNIKIISCCATGKKLDPTKLLITDIWQTKNDPLAKKLRYLLKKENIKYKLPVVSSTEIPINKNNVISSICLVPNFAGILLVSYIIKDLFNE